MVERAWSGWRIILLSLKLAAHRRVLGNFLMALNLWAFLSLPVLKLQPRRVYSTSECFLDRDWKQNARRSCISWIFLFAFETRTTFLTTSPSRRGNDSGSFGTEHSSADHILFHLDGKPISSSYVRQVTYFELGLWYHQWILQKPPGKSIRGVGRL